MRCNSDQDGRTGTFLGCVRLLVKTCARRNTAHLHPLCAQRTSLRASDSPDKAQHQLSSPKLRIPIPCYTSYHIIWPSYTPLPGVMTALALRTSLILVVEFHAVCRCTICGAQVDSKARIPGITMTAISAVLSLLFVVAGSETAPLRLAGPVPSRLALFDISAAGAFSLEVHAHHPRVPPWYAQCNLALLLK